MIAFADGTPGPLPRITAGPFRYARQADDYVRAALRYAQVPVKQGAIAGSALSLIYAEGGISGYSGEDFRPT